MKIALVTYGIKFGGIETFLKRLAVFLLNQGHEVQVVETEEHGEWADEFRESGLTVLDVLGHPLRSRRHHAFRIAKALRKFDVVILNDAPFAQAVLGLLPQTTASFPIVHLDMPSFYANATGSRGEWDAVVSVGPRITRTLLEQHRVPGMMIREIPYGVEVPEAWRKANSNTEPTRELRAVYIGRLEDRQKGIMRLPGILRRASEQIGISFDIVGNGPDNERLRTALLQTCPDLQARFHGLLDKDRTRAVLREQDVLLLPSNFEGYPIVVLEAMAEGVVPVVSNLPDITDHQIRHGSNGFLVEPGDTDGFAAALVEVGRDREKLRTMSQAAWSEAQERFKVEQMCQRYAALIRELHAANTKGSRPRPGKIALELLGDLPSLPLCLVRPVRMGLRILGLWRDSREAA